MAKKSLVVRISESEHVDKTDEVLLESIIAVHDTYSTPFRTVLVLQGGYELRCNEDPREIRKMLHELNLWASVHLNGTNNAQGVQACRGSPVRRN